MAIIYIPNHLYPTPSASGKITRYTSCTPLYNKRQTFTSIHSIAKTLKKASQNFSVFQPPYYVLILYYATTPSMLLHFLYLISLRIFELKKSQIPFIHLVSSHPFTSFLSTNPVQNSTKSCQISRFLRLRWTRIQNILLRIHLSLSLYYKLSPGFPQSLFSMR